MNNEAENEVQGKRRALSVVWDVASRDKTEISLCKLEKKAPSQFSLYWPLRPSNVLLLLGLLQVQSIIQASS